MPTPAAVRYRKILASRRPEESIHHAGRMFPGKIYGGRGSVGDFARGWLP